MSALAGLLMRGQRIAREAAERRRERIVAEAGDMPGVTASVEGEAVVLEGRGLMRRWASDLAFREIGR